MDYTCQAVDNITLCRSCRLTKLHLATPALIWLNKPPTENSLASKTGVV